MAVAPALSFGTYPLPEALNAERQLFPAQLDLNTSEGSQRLAHAPRLQRTWQRLEPGTTDYDGRAVKASCSAHLIDELECGRGKRLSSKRGVSGANESGCFDGTPTDARGLRALERRLRMRILELGLLAIAASGLIGATAVSAPMSEAQVGKLLPEKMPRIGAIDERYQSFNVEMLEVTGGDFWRPYASLDSGSKTKPDPGRASSGVPAGMSADLYQYRPPIDLSNARLRKLAAALGPAYMRVSGTWANTTHFHDADTPAPTVPPDGFGGVLTRQQWKGVIDFAHAIDAKLVSSFATSVGVRDAAGVWTPVEATKVLQYTHSIGGSIAAAEFMNEPTMAAMGGAPKGYDGAAYGRDVAVFVPFIKSRTLEMIVLGPGSVGEGGSFSPTTVGLLKSEDLLAAAGPVFDAFSYHYYGGASERCASTMPDSGTTAAAALSQEWLAGTDQVEKFYANLRDRFEPGRPMWITETADTACGGNRWGSTFLDTFRYVDQLGRLAQRSLQVVIHNTLASSDYGLLDENTYLPRPNYWAALIWRRLMGTTVLDPALPRHRSCTSTHNACAENLEA